MKYFWKINQYLKKKFKIRIQRSKQIKINTKTDITIYNNYIKIIYLEIYLLYNYYI